MDVDGSVPQGRRARRGAAWMPPEPRFTDGRDHTIQAGSQRILEYRVRRGAAEFVVSRSSMIGRRQAQSFPATAEGWGLAWRLFAAEDPGAASSFADELRELQRRRQAAEPEAQQAFAEQESSERMRLRAARRELRSRPKLAVVENCTVQGGFGFDELPSGAMTDLYFEDERLIVTESGSPEPIATLRYVDVVTLQIDGPGARKSGGGFVGGGFGVTGAAKGMFMVAALNQLTSSTTITTVIEIQDADRDLIWTNSTLTPEQISYQLKPVFAKLRVVHGGSPGPTPPSRRAQQPDLVAQLEKLADLRQAGVLTESEFQAAKARILR